MHRGLALFPGAIGFRHDEHLVGPAVAASATSSTSTIVVGRTPSPKRSTNMAVVRWMRSSFCALESAACGILMLANGIVVSFSGADWVSGFRVERVAEDTGDCPLRSRRHWRG